MQKLHRHDVVVLITAVALVVFASFLRFLGNNGAFPLTTGYLRNLILIGLVFVWGFSVRKRVTQRSVRRYLLLIVALILFWLVERTCKYLFLFEMVDETRYAWYLFYVPMVMVPLFGIFAAVCMGESDDYKLPKPLYFLFIPAFASIISVLTNDLHQFVFRFPGGIPDEGNDYSYGPLYFAIMAWIIVEVVTFLLVLFAKSRVPGKRKRIILPVFIILIALLYAGLYVSEIPIVRTIAGDLTSVMSLLIMAVFEACIYTGLIQSNRHYDDLFDISTVGAQITYPDYRVYLSSETSRPLSSDILRKAEKSSLLLDDGFLLSGRPIRGGHTFWLDDVSDISDAISELRDINDTLEESNTARREENMSLKKKTRLKELNRMYNKMQLETADQISELQEKLAEFEKAESIDDEKQLLGTIMVIGAYIKRRNNLLCILEKQKMIEISDLEYCLRESIEALQIQGIGCGYSVHLSGNMDVRVIMRIYDAFEQVVEKMLGRMTHLFAVVKRTGSRCSLLIEIRTGSDLRKLAPDGFLCEDEGDGAWLLTFETEAEEGDDE